MSKAVFICVTVLGLIAVPALADRMQPVLPQNDNVQRMNRFMQELYGLHQKLIDGLKVRTTSQIGGYARQPKFYKEVRYYDAASGRLLSKIEWETAHPDRIHSIEVYVYDDRNRVVRDFAGWYLPQARNAPRDTFINLHAYNDGLHAYRQFDALDNRTYEFCEGSYQGRPASLALWEQDIIDALDEPKSVMTTALYKACFAGLPVTSAGKYLTPQ